MFCCYSVPKEHTQWNARYVKFLLQVFIHVFDLKTNGP